MSRKNLSRIAVIVVLLIAGALYYTSAPTKVSEDVNVPSGKASMVDHVISDYKISLQYPSNLYLLERKNNLSQNEKYSLLLVENTQENVDVVTGKSTVPREGPISINLTVYENKEKLSPITFAQQQDTWGLSNKETVATVVGGANAYTFEWDGLYRGRTTVVGHGDYVYVFSVTFFEESDQLTRDAQMILNSVTFLP